MIIYDPTTDIMATPKLEFTWPPYYPPYNSLLGWEVQKLDAQIEVCKWAARNAKSLKTELNIVSLRAKAELKRHELIGEFIFKK